MNHNLCLQTFLFPLSLWPYILKKIQYRRVMLTDQQAIQKQYNNKYGWLKISNKIAILLHEQVNLLNMQPQYWRFCKLHYYLQDM